MGERKSRHPQATPDNIVRSLSVEKTLYEKVDGVESQIRITGINPKSNEFILQFEDNVQDPIKQDLLIGLFQRGTVYVKEEAPVNKADTVVKKTHKEKPKKRQPKKNYFGQCNKIFDEANEEERKALLGRLTNREKGIFFARRGDENGSRHQGEAAKLLGISVKPFSTTEKNILAKFRNIPIPCYPQEAEATFEPSSHTFREALFDISKAMSPQERKVFKLHYGFVPRGKQLSLEEIMGNEDMSEREVINAHNGALEKLTQNETISHLTLQYQSDKSIQRAFQKKTLQPAAALLEELSKKIGR